MSWVTVLVLLVALYGCTVYGYEYEGRFDSLNPPPGHLMPLGWHTHPIHVETRLHVPSPEEFYTRYASKSVPVVFKGAAVTFPAFQKWTDDYLRKYGDWKVVVEDGKKEDMSRPTYMMSLNTWLNGYIGNDTYLVQDIVPPNPMTKEIPIPRCLQCGGFQNNIETAIMWFSSGGTKSRFHSEQVDNFECMFSGWKEYILIDKVTGQTLFMDSKYEYSGLDVDRVDMYKFPALQNITWHKLHVEPGDCFFIPYKWYHFANSSNTRNMAVSFWLTHQFRYTDDCQYPEKRKTTLFDVKTSNNEESSRVEVLELFFQDEKMSLETFRKFFALNDTTEENTELTLGRRGQITKTWLKDHKANALDKIFEMIDTNQDKLLSIDEVYDADLNLFIRLIGSLGDHYFKYETLEDGGGNNGGGWNAGKDILSAKKLKYLRNEL